MLVPSKLWPETALDTESNAVGATVGAGTPLCFLLLPCCSESLRSAASDSPRRPSGSMMFGSFGAKLAAADCCWLAPATLTSVTDAVTASNRAIAAFHKRFIRILSPSSLARLYSAVDNRRSSPVGPSL